MKRLKSKYGVLTLYPPESLYGFRTMNDGRSRGWINSKGVAYVSGFWLDGRTIIFANVPLIDCTLTKA